MDGDGRPALVAEGARESVAAFLGLHEDQHPSRVVVLLWDGVTWVLVVVRDRPVRSRRSSVVVALLLLWQKI